MVRHYDRAREAAIGRHEPLLVCLVKRGSSQARELVAKIERAYGNSMPFVPVLIALAIRRSYPIKLYYAGAVPHFS